MLLLYLKFFITIYIIINIILKSIFSIIYNRGFYSTQSNINIINNDNNANIKNDKLESSKYKEFRDCHYNKLKEIIKDKYGDIINIHSIEINSDYVLVLEIYTKDNFTILLKVVVDKSLKIKKSDIVTPNVGFNDNQKFVKILEDNKFYLIPTLFLSKYCELSTEDYILNEEDKKWCFKNKNAEMCYDVKTDEQVSYKITNK